MSRNLIITLNNDFHALDGHISLIPDRGFSDVKSVSQFRYLEELVKITLLNNNYPAFIDVWVISKIG